MRGLLLALAVGSAPVLAAADCAEARLDLRGDWGSARFTVELADDAEEVTRGLMHRDSLAASAGMLFVYPRPGPVAFWMKNTLIPLDMVFAGADGVVRKVHANAVPHDETPIFGGEDIQYVLEINGGMAATLGIAAGTEMRHPAIDQEIAAWACAAGG